MDYNDLLQLYDKKNKKYNGDAYRHISELFKEAKAQHRLDYLSRDDVIKKKKSGKTVDPDQSWRAFKGKNFEKLLLHIIINHVEEIGFKVMPGSKLEGSNLSESMSIIKRKLVVDYGKFGCHLPDADLVIYTPKNLDVIAIVSSKTSLRERFAQTGYWKLKLLDNPVTSQIRVFFMTLDEDHTLTNKKLLHKGRAIAEVDTDGTYVLTSDNIDESDHVKLFGKFIADLQLIRKKKLRMVKIRSDVCM